MMGLERNPTATAGATDLYATSNGTVTLTSDYLISYAKLDLRGAIVIEPVVVLP